MLVHGCHNGHGFWLNCMLVMAHYIFMPAVVLLYAADCSQGLHAVGNSVLE